MLRRLFRSQATKAVQDSMYYLLNFQYQKLIDRFFSAYPAFDSIISNRRKDGADSLTIAVELLSIAFSDTIARSQLTSAERTAIEDHICGRVADGTNLAKAARAFLWNCKLQQDLKKIDEYHSTYAISEIVGALRGMDSNERSNRRSIAAFEAVLLPRQDPP